MSNIRDSENNRQPRHGRWHYVWIGLAGIIVVSACGITIRAVYNYKAIKSIDNNFTPAQISIAVQENGNDNENPVYISSDDEANALKWVADTEGNTYTATKKVKIKNLNLEDENNADAYIRVCMIPRWIRRVYVDTDGNMYDTKPKDTECTEQYIDITTSSQYSASGSLTDIKINNNTFSMGDVTFALNEKWSDNWIFNSKDGYFYYKNIVSPEDTSSDDPTGITELLLESVSISKAVYDSMGDNIFLRVDIMADAIQTEGDAVANRWGSSGITVVTIDNTPQLSIANNNTEDNTKNEQPDEAEE
jgi:hypothetical protein